MPYNFVPDSFHSHTKKLQAKCDFARKTAVLRIWSFVELRDDVRCLSWAYWKARSGLPISVNWTSVRENVCNNSKNV